MKKLKLMLMAFIALSVSFSACQKNDNEPKPDVDEIVEDGFYVSGAATGSEKLVANAIMAAGTNEANDNKVREGMYEKYIALKGGQTFQLLLKEGVKETKYGAELQAINLAPNGESVDDQPIVTVQKGKLKENGTLKVEKDGLYHIVLDLNKAKDLEYAQIVIAPVSWGLRGGFNGWGFTEMTASQFDFSTMTFTAEGVEINSTDEFKFAYGQGWKIQLDTEGLVKSNTNLGDKMQPGGANIKLDTGAVYTVTLTWTLKQGSIADGYKVTYKKTGDVVPPVSKYPKELYMIGSDIGGWDWSGDYIISMTPVHSHEYAFWTIAYLTPPATAPGFKFAPAKEWNGDFGVQGEATDGIYAKGTNNATVSQAGYYMIYVDLKAEKISITEPYVYLMGATMNNKWDYAMETAKFSVDATNKTLVSPAFEADGELRMYATCPLSQMEEGAKVDWWQMEFIVLDSKIAYRGVGGDQERVSVTAGQKATLNFSTGAATIQ